VKNRASIVTAPTSEMRSPIRSSRPDGAVAAIDLHTHTTASDGSLAPAALVALAAESGVSVLGITDHDTTAGIAEALAAGQRHGVTVVPGIELNSDFEDRHCDILGYFIDSENEPLRALMTRLQHARAERAVIIVEKLNGLGVAISIDEVIAIADGGAVGRPHIARALVARGHVADVSEAFRLYIGRRGPAYADRYRLSPAEACAFIRAAGGVPVLAHPVPPSDPFSDPLKLLTFLPGLVEAGLGGLECYYAGYTARVSRWLDALAWHFHLVPTGGSDYHGPWRQDRVLGCVEVPAETVEKLRQAARDGRVPAGAG
jgi:predicted metal-dependent phosphoesterase TrpH